MSAGVGERKSVSNDTAIICFSHLRWNFVYQRPQHLISRAARSYPVWYFEEPIYEPGAASRLETRCDDASGVHVAVPILPEGTEPDDVIVMLRGLVSGLDRKSVV